MLTRPATRVGNERRGVILMVVLALLTLFAILGLSFVFYSDAAATSSRIYREGQSLNRAGSDMDRSIIDVSSAWTNFLGQLVYDVNDNPNGTTFDTSVMSGLRGHSLARTTYGWNDSSGALNDKPYCGTGRLNETLPQGLMGQQAVNYTYFPADGFLRDPGRQGTRANASQQRGALVGDVNVPYTYPDHNNMALAMIDPNTGKVLLPSYHRPWLGFGSLAPTNPNWTDTKNTSWKYMTMRPRPADVGAGFPLPPDATGDVKNLDWAPGNNDSIWIDFNAPIITLPDGTQYKILAAPLIIDLDGRVNMNVAGNILASTPPTNPTSFVHGSNQGWGPYEVNLGTVLNVAANTGEWANVFKGNGTVVGRYSNAKPPTPMPSNGSPPTSGGQPVRNTFLMDYNTIIDAGNSGFPGLTSQWTLPTAGTTSSYQVFPSYNSKSGYGNYVNEINSPNPVHPSIFNSLSPSNGNRIFSYNDLAAMLRLTNMGGENATSNLLDLLPNNLLGTGLPDFVPQTGNQLSGAGQRRARVTTHSFDLDRPGLVPYIWDPQAGLPGHTNNGLSTAMRFRFNGNTLGNYPKPAPFQLTNAMLGQTPPTLSEFASNWQSVLSALNRIDLCRTLTTYPALGGNNQFDPNNAQFKQAVTDRQALAGDIFIALIGVTGAIPLMVPGSSPAQGVLGTGTYNAASQEYQAVRWLAQLAVNIVDFIDYDDFSTPFQWRSKPIQPSRPIARTSPRTGFSAPRCRGS